MEDVVNKTIVKPYGFVYITTNMANGKKYLGQRKFSDGWQKYLGSGVLIKDAINKYGVESFHRNIVCFCYSEDELNETEYNLSVWLDVVESPDWYNLVIGGGASCGWHPSEETKNKISQKAKERLSNPENHPMYGKQGLIGENNPMYGVSLKDRMDEDTYQQWYEKHTLYWESHPRKGTPIWDDKPHPCLGQKLSDTQREIISQKAIERYQNKENHPMYGQHHTDEARQKMSSKRNDGQMYCCKPIFCPELNQYFYAASEAEKILHIDASAIRKCIRGDKHRKTAGRHPDTQEKLHWYSVTKEEYENYITKQNDLKENDRLWQEQE